MNTNKLYLAFVFIFLIGVVSASAPTLGTFELNKEIELKQSCVINGTFCDLCNISSVDFPNGSRIVSDVEMTKRAGDFNYTLSSVHTYAIGRYRANGYCDFGSDVRKNWVYYFEVTPSGFAGTLGFYFLILILSLGIMVLGFYLLDAPIVILGTFGLYFLGLYILFYGIDGIRDPTYTWAIGIIVLGVAFYVSVKSAYELITSAE